MENNNNNNNGKGLFYAIIGIATLITAIIGATFAFFTATGANNTTTVTGKTATASSISLAVTQVLPSAAANQGTSGRMVPLNTSDMTTALRASCIDSNGYVACQVYQITLTNSGADAVLATTTLQLTTLNGIANMKWQVLSGTSASDFAVTGTAVSSHSSASTVKASDSVSGSNGTKTYYVVVWLDNLSSDQTSSDAGKVFSGTVTANVVDANGGNLSQLKATFS